MDIALHKNNIRYVNFAFLQILNIQTNFFKQSITMKKLFTIFSVSLSLAVVTATAQVKIGIPAGAPAASSILDLSNTGAAATAKKGFLGPQVALSGNDDATTVPSPAIGLMVFNTTAAGTGATAVSVGYYYFDGTWKQMVSSAAPTSGNIYTADGTLTGNRTLNSGGFKLNLNTKVGFGTITPASQLEVFASTQITSLATDSGYIMLGQGGSVHQLFDFNSIQTKNNATTAGVLNLNPFGGGVNISNASNILLNGSLQTAFLATSTNTTLTTAHHILKATNTGLNSVTTFTLPTNSAALAGREYVFIAPIQGANNFIGQAMTARATIASATANIIINGEAAGLSSFDMMGSSTCTAISDGTNWIITGASPNQFQVEKADLSTDQLIVNFASAQLRGGIMKVEGGQHTASGGGTGNFYINLLIDVQEGTFAKAEMFGHGTSQTPTFNTAKTVVSFADGGGFVYTYTISGTNLNFKNSSGGSRPLRVTITKL